MTETIQLSHSLRQMLAVLESERQALAGLDVAAIMGAAADKRELCASIDAADSAELDEECRGLADAARRLNEANRQIRNLIAANVSARLEALTGQARTYSAAPAYSRAITRG